MINEGQPIPVFNYGKYERDYTYIDDIVHGLNKIMASDYSCDIVNLGESQTISTNELIHLIESDLGKTAIRRLMPAQTGDVDITFANIEHAKLMYGYEPKTNIIDGIRKFVEWYQSQNA